VAVNEAVKFLDQGLKEVNNPPVWQTTLAAAKTATQQAEALLAHEPELLEEASGQRVGQLRARLDADEKDHRLVAAFEQVLFKLNEPGRGNLDIEVYQELRGALALWGLPLADVPVDRARALLQQCPRPMQDQLAALLHFCLSCVPTQQKQQGQWLREVLAAADPDAWRQHVRQAMARADAELLTRLMAQADVAQQQPLVLVQVAWSAPLLENHLVRIRLLRRAQQRHPGDFWVNCYLGVALYFSVFPEGKDTRAARGRSWGWCARRWGFVGSR
jgi:hypothetical protein